MSRPTTNNQELEENGANTGRSAVQSVDSSVQSSMYHTAPFIQSTLRHSQVGTKIRDPQNRVSVQAEPDHINDTSDESSSLIEACKDIKEPATLHECSDKVNASDLVQRATSQDAAQAPRVASATDELQSILANSNILSGSGGITSPSTVTWLLKEFIALYHRYPNFAHAIIFLAAICMSVYFYASSHGEVILSQAAYLDVEQVQVTGVSDIGLSIHIASSIMFDYSKITNWFNRLIGVSASMLLGTVTLTPRGPVDIFALIENVEDVHRLVRVTPPEMVVDLQSRRITALEFDTTISVISTSAVIIANRLLDLRAAGSKNANVSVTGSFGFDVGTSIKNYKDVTYDMRELIEIDLWHQLPDNFIDSFTLNLHDNDPTTLEASIDLTTKALEFPINLDFGELEWDILLPLCSKSRLLEIGSAVTKEITLRPLSKVAISADVTIDELPRQFIRHCPGKQLSPLNQFLIDFMNHDLSRNVYLTFSETENYSLPFWLQFILRRVNLPIPLGLEALGNKHFCWQDLLQSFAFSEAFVKLDGKTEQVKISSVATIVLKYPELLENYKRFSITEFKSSVKAAYDEQELFAMVMDHSEMIKINYTDEFICIDINGADLTVDIGEPQVISLVLNEYLSGNSTTMVVESINDFDVTSPIFDSWLYDLPLDTNITIPGAPSSDLLLSNLNVSISNILLVEDTKNTVTLWIDVEISNPFPIGLDATDLSLSVLFASDETPLGVIEAQELPVFKGEERFNASFSLLIDPISLNEKNPVRAVTELERFLSGFASGNDSVVSVVGHGKSIYGFPKLSEIVDGMSVDFDLAQASYPGVDNGNKGFLVSSTMHIMTSEIEFTVYNPINNSQVVIQIIQAQASLDGTVLGHLEKQELLYISPGLYKTPRMPITLAGGIGGSILRHALNGKLDIHADAIFELSLGEFRLQLVYSGDGLTTNVRF